jgi:hypothetical protein
VRQLLSEAQGLVAQARSGSGAQHVVSLQPPAATKLALFRMLVEFEQRLRVEAGACMLRAKRVRRRGRPFRVREQDDHL